MNREPINKQNLSDAVAEKLREYIRSSDAPRSLKLPPEAVIGESMGASRITVRRSSRSEPPPSDRCATEPGTPPAPCRSPTPRLS